MRITVDSIVYIVTTKADVLSLCAKLAKSKDKAA